MIKKNLHPKTYNTTIICNNKKVLELITIKPEISVDLWSGNHPFYTGTKKIIDTEKKIQKFENKYLKLKKK